MWKEVSFFSRWWHNASEEQKALVIRTRKEVRFKVFYHSAIHLGIHCLK